MNKQKMIVSDYDQTFYINDNDIENNKIFANKFMNDGNIFVIATGRSYLDFINELNKYHFNYNYVIINHGSTILDKNNNIIKNCYINNDVIDKIYNDLDIENSINYSCCNIYDEISSFNTKNLTKIRVKYSTKDKAMQMVKKINKKYGKNVNIYYVNYNSIEIISSEVDKSKSVEEVIKLVDINKENVYTIGDGYSDIEMIKKFNGYCMKESVQELLDICKDKVVYSVSTLFDIVYKNDLYNFLSNYDFFKNLGKYEIISIQDYGRRSKFKIKTSNTFYTLILTENRINPYIEKIKILGKKFESIVGLKYLSNDNKVLVLDYYGENKGLDVIKLECDGFQVDDDTYVTQFKEIIDNIHSNKKDYINFDKNKNYNGWEDYYIDELTSRINSINNKIIDNNTCNNLIEKLIDSKRMLRLRENSFIHADITPLNVCINPETKQLYLIDYDDFKIGDPLIDISRIINFKTSSKLFAKLIDKYYSKYEEDINHLFYTLRVYINWYNHILKNHQENIYDIDKAKKEIIEVIDKILKI